jgi:hypothetical protein
MRVNKKFVGFNVDSEDEQLLDNFIGFLKRKLPLKKDITIEFLKSRYGKMSTGSRTNKHIIKILVKDRMNRDILRTIAHEWAHEYQRTIENMEKGPDIGGKNENKANERSGELVKRFERRHKKDEKTIYSLFNERIKELEAQGYYVIKLIKTNKNGIPDLIAIPKNSDVLFIEVKGPNGKTSPLQDFRLEELEKHGIKTEIYKPI